ncbi:MAG: response regulator [Vicinamibacterales bacterium]
MATVLVVDDDPDIRLLVQLALAAGGHVVETAGTAPAALDVLATRPFDVVVTDLNLDQDIGGEELLRRIQAAGHGVGVILISGFVEMGDTARFHELGAADFIAKPFDLRDLVAAVNRVAAAGGSRRG